MAINIDTVYQKVLAITNKEQRGYITPQEFNLLASKAQDDIFENYFHDIKTAYQKRKNHTGYSDELEILDEKLHPFRTSTTFTQIADNPTLNISGNTAALYYLDTITKADGEITKMSQHELVYTENNPLTRATASRMVYVRDSEAFATLYPTPTVSTEMVINYLQTPTTPNWSYIVVNEKALFNANLATNFQLHVSEEENLVTKILLLAGAIIKQPDIQQVAMADAQMRTQEKNN